MTLSQADNFACWWTEFLKDHSSTLIVAGSIRRRRTIVGDVDIVCIPKTETVSRPSGDMFSGPTTETVNCAYEAVMRLALEKGFAWKGKGGAAPPPKPGCKFMWLVTPKCELDLWFADETNLTTRLICRTGSMEHNIFICQRAESLGMKWNPYEGLMRTRGLAEPELVPTPNEAAFYEALKMEYVPPALREGDWLRRHYC